VMYISVVTWPILPGQSVTVGAQDVIVYTDVTEIVEVISVGGIGITVIVGTPWLEETGHTVVYRGIVLVITWPRGQLVTVGAHEVIVSISVV
jgi:hypothetical protein